ncbi:MAG: arginine--tRNA ligase [Candidatus Woesearchaeota archaeon]
MQSFESDVRELLEGLIPGQTIALAQPPDQSMGDLAFACFELAKSQHKNPADIAGELATALKPEGLVKKIEAMGPYVNFFVDKQALFALLSKQIERKKDRFGAGKRQRERIMVEFFHANTHKAVHIGHVRTMCLGIALSNILEFYGHKVFRANYQGDIGPHVVKCIWGLMRFKEEPSNESKLKWLGEIYTRAHHLIDGNEELEQEIKSMTKKLYDGDPELVKIWKETRQWCLDDFNKMYEEFGVKFDRLFFESEVEPRGKKIVKDLLKKGIAKESEGAIIMDLEQHGLGIFLLLRNDGVALYSTKDLALAQLKFKEFKVERNIHVVGAEQELYFRQLKKTLELIGSPNANKLYHLSYGLVMLPEGKMSSRVGTVVLYEDLKQRLYDAAEKSTRERHDDWDASKIDQTKRLLAFSALKFGMVSRETNKSLLFDWDKALDFEGETGPYVQYAFARICSILRKHDKPLAKRIDYNLLSAPHEERIISLLSGFESRVSEAATHYRPYVLAKFLVELAQAFNEFYHACPILQEKEGLMHARLALITSVRQVLANGLMLLGIQAPEMM